MTHPSVLDLKHAIQSGLSPLQWWKSSIAPMLEPDRIIALSEISKFLSSEIREISNVATALVVDKFQFPELFTSILFEFLFPLHARLVMQKNWGEALALESVLYGLYIKQDENSDFYELTFENLYAPYNQTFLNSSEINTSSINSSGEDLIFDMQMPEEKTLFWFQTYSLLAHSSVVLEFAESINRPGVFYASALENIGLNEVSNKFLMAGIKILPINDQLDITKRCEQLVELCRHYDIKNIVFVSLPLQSGFLKTIAKDISLTWWSMKYPLGCMPHFDRRICNRSLIPEMRVIYGAKWLCGPFAIKPLSPSPSSMPTDQSICSLNIGVLSRTEKFASSSLPEIISKSLLMSPNIGFFWTGRNHDPAIEMRLRSAAPLNPESRIKFCGWVEPYDFLSKIDVLVDTPNLGGLVAYWMMSMGKVVLSATDSGSIGALGSRETLSQFFQHLRTPDDVEKYFFTESDYPFYLANPDLIPLCIQLYSNHPSLLINHGKRFSSFFTSNLSDLDRWGKITFQMLQGKYLN